MHNKILETFEYIHERVKGEYKVGIILGTGLGGLVKEIEIENSIEYSNIPHFPVSTVEFHKGNLIFGMLSGVRVVAMQGRFHFYEGYSHHLITYPIYIFKKLGVKHLIVSNACGALNPNLKKSDLMLITGHINLHFNTPLYGNIRFNNKSSKHFYSRELISLAEKTALENRIPIKKGVYASVTGPNLETRAEYRALRKMTADAVGMSTIPEIIIAHKLGIKSLGISIVTDEGYPDTLKPANIEEIIKVAGIAEPKLTLLTAKVVEKLKAFN
ncbi:MAG: purine-nucleoside phosphorylase [Ignavibacteria bacterium]|nr:purine-nucleoside phosphorylase [Ignavibacteria bacterium]